ncbi:uncharacterized protein LOC105390172 [Plutella xylostella]|uniref:uncharacterized protein LOC105390172 n=1 Tax=Plutella xylostella TaxID=51655 RepID=UPI0020329D70|nr:uncharacterized protein LOC105390172 [Plutella xylostella]
MAAVARTVLLSSILALTLQSTSANSMKQKTNSRPVIEIINEQARVDTRVTKLPGLLPYGNPLSGQNARLHAQNQQAMFNAERVRQHRAQVQRWTNAPIKMDSYMKAYHDSQENHQIALEQQQAKAKDLTPPAGPNKRLPRLKEPLTSVMRDEARGLKAPAITKLTKEDAVINDKPRSHRSFGSDHQHYLANKRFQSVYVSPAPAYDQGVTIKPNGNVGISQFNSQIKAPSKLYTSVVPSDTKYVYPKIHQQMQGYKSSQDMDALSSLLKKAPSDQLSQLSALIQSSKEQSDVPIDLYFYTKDHNKINPVQTVNDFYDTTKYNALSYAGAYIPEHKDHTPITEEIDDVADPNQLNKLKTYGLQKQLQEAMNNRPDMFHPENLETTTMKSNNYYKVEVASQTITSGVTGYKPLFNHVHPQYYASEDITPTYETLQYPHPTVYAQKEPKQHGDQSEMYLHHNAQHKGVQHLTGDGTGVSAYGDENLHYAANYEFGYRVRDHHSGNDFGHHEVKEGEKTNGAYHVLLPDGRMQKVQYSAGPEGFHADISYDHLQH